LASTSDPQKGNFMLRKFTAEAVGTFWLVFGGCGSAVLAAGYPELGIGFAGVSLAFYLATGKPHFRRWGVLTLKWTLLAALGFFVVLILERVL
jgi:glycerol uptake facilitator-like aquaporin